jgi:hypothetical protein
MSPGRSSGQMIVRVQIGVKAFVLGVDTGVGNSHLDQYRTPQSCCRME